jgi:hypothetical protein
MYPSRDPFGGSGYDPQFAGTFMSGGSEFLPSQQHGHALGPRGPRSTRSQQHQDPSQ